MKLIPRIVVNLVYLYRLISVVSVTAESCEDVRVDTISNKYLGGYIYRTVSPYGYQQCVTLCMEQRECQSINYHKPNLVCDLNTETTDTEGSLSVKDGTIFKDMNTTTYPTPPAENCQKTTCPEYHTCVKLTNGNTVCTAPVPDITTTTTTTPTTTTTTTTTTPTTTTAATLTCVSPYTTDAPTGLCLYYGTGKTWADANTNCPSTGRLFVADTEDKKTSARSMCPSSTSCWIGASGSGGAFTWSTGEVFIPDQTYSGDCIRAKDNVLKAGGCSYAVSYICEQT